MDKALLGQEIEISRIGMGGHYKATEEGNYEYRYAYVDKEVENRIKLVKRLLSAGSLVIKNLLKGISTWSIKWR